MPCVGLDIALSLLVHKIAKQRCALKILDAISALLSYTTKYSFSNRSNYLYRFTMNKYIGFNIDSKQTTGCVMQKNKLATLNIIIRRIKAIKTVGVACLNNPMYSI